MLLENDCQNWPTKLFRNRISGDRFLAAENPNGDVYYADLDENNIPVNAGNWFPKEEYAEMLNNLELELDENTVPLADSRRHIVLSSTLDKVGWNSTQIVREEGKCNG
jgi:hypothetical protein